MDESLRFSAKMGIPDDTVSRIRRETKIVIISDPATAGSYSGQVMLETSANILARMFPHVEVRLSAVTATHLKSQKDLSEYLLEIIRDAYRWNGFGADEVTKEVNLVVGGAAACSAVHIDADGWRAYIGAEPSGLTRRENDTVSIGAVVAGCLGASEIFKLLFEGVTNRPCFRVGSGLWLNTLTYDDSKLNPLIPELRLEGVVLFGSGSVGSSLFYSIGFLPIVTGTMDVVDRDKKVDFPNLQRYTYLNVSDIVEFQGIPKANWAAAKLQRKFPLLTVNPWIGKNGTVTGYLNSRPATPGINIAISAVDNIDARIQIADCLARRTINAGTGDTTLTITRHGFADGRACLACEYIGQLPNVTWFQEVSNNTGIPVDRVAVLLDGKAILNDEDIRLMVEKRFIDQSQGRELLDTDLSSVVNRRLYSAVGVQQGGGSEKPVTAPFVSLMAGALLAGELIKEAMGLQNSWASNKYSTDLLSVPSMGGSFVVKALQGCLCHNAFRVGKYNSLWMTKLENCLA